MKSKIFLGSFLLLTSFIGVNAQSTSYTPNNNPINPTGGTGNSTAFGRGVLGANTTGMQNSGTGYQALQSNTTGDNNSAHGYQSLNANVSGADNTACGYNSMLLNVEGQFNVAN